MRTPARFLGVLLLSGLAAPGLMPDVETVPDAYRRQPAPRALTGYPHGGDYYDTSEFMIGSVAVGIILLESDGTYEAESENWTTAEIDLVRNEILAGLDWWDQETARFYHPGLFTVDAWELHVVPTGYEPIRHSSAEDHLWIVDGMNRFGYADSTELGVGFAYANDLRDAYDTDWALVAFVVDSSADPDGAFTNGFFAYAKLGGPFFVLTFDNAGWGIARMNQVAAHETGHIFYALDQYGSCNCASLAGYLAVPNQNCEQSCVMDVRSIMKDNSVDLDPDPYARGQLGWPDADLDSLPDILDTFPQTALGPPPSDPTTDPTPTFTGTGVAVPLPNQNPRGAGHDITLNTVSVEYRVGDGPWMPAQAIDGSFDSGMEPYTFTLDSLVTGGRYVVQAQARHSTGNYDPSPAFRAFTYEPATTGVASAGGAVDETAMATPSLAVHPNPARSSCDIICRFPAGTARTVRIDIVDVRGRRVRVLHEGTATSGEQRLRWNGCGEDGRAVASGIYLARLAFIGMQPGPGAPPGPDILVARVLLIR